MPGSGLPVLLGVFLFMRFDVKTLTRLIRLACLFVHEIGYENVDQGQRL